MSEVDDLLVFDTQLNEKIPFATVSDAKIARLALTLNVPPYYVDLFFNVICDPFFKPGDVTLSGGRDIYQHVTDFCTKQREIRSICRPQEVVSASIPKTPLGSSSCRPFPMFVLYNVIDHLLQEMRVHDNNSSDYRFDAWKRDRFTFQSMTLVDRSWTVPAQRALTFWRRYAFSWDMRKDLCNPTFGWTNRLQLDISGPFDLDRPGFLYSFQQLARTFGRSGVLRRLYIWFRLFCKEDIPLLREIVKSIPAISSLEELVVIACQARSVSLTACNILPELHNLRRFTLKCDEYEYEHDMHEGMDDPAVKDGLCGLRSLVPGKRLEHISISSYGDMGMVLPILRRIAVPRKDGHIKSFCWDVGQLSVGPEMDSEPWTRQVFDVIRPSFPYLSSIEIHTTFAREGPDVDSDLELFRMIKRECISLRQLSICECMCLRRFPKHVKSAIEADAVGFEFRRCSTNDVFKHLKNRSGCDEWQDDTIY
jgi:hypothetical protein